MFSTTLLHLKACGRGQAQGFASISDNCEFECSECQDTTSVWLCVTCGALNCGRSVILTLCGISQIVTYNLANEHRYVAAHGLKHKEKTKSHSVCMETNELSVFCYDCDEFVINDTADK